MKEEKMVLITMYRGLEKQEKNDPFRLICTLLRATFDQYCRLVSCLTVSVKQYFKL